MPIQGLVGEVVLRQESILIDDVSVEPRLAGKLADRTVQTLIYVPVLAEGRTVAVLEVPPCSRSTPVPLVTLVPVVLPESALFQGTWYPWYSWHPRHR